MTPLKPPRLAVAVLTWFVRNESLVGDLLEEFQSRRSAAWLWRQTLLAVVISAWRAPFAAPEWQSGPLHLRTSDAGSTYAGPLVHRSFPMTTINMSGIPVAGVGGLGMLATSMLITIVLPQAWWLVVAGVVGGVVVGIVKIVGSRQFGLSGGSNGDGPNTLFRESRTQRNPPMGRHYAPGGKELVAVRP